MRHCRRVSSVLGAKGCQFRDQAISKGCAAILRAGPSMRHNSRDPAGSEDRAHRHTSRRRNNRLTLASVSRHKRGNRIECSRNPKPSSTSRRDHNLGIGVSTEVEAYSRFSRQSRLSVDVDSRFHRVFDLRSALEGRFAPSHCLDNFRPIGEGEIDHQRRHRGHGLDIILDWTAS